MHTITLQFESEDQAVGWFVAACQLGAIPEEAGLREPLPHSFIVSQHPGAWLVEPRARRQGCEQNVPVNPEDPLTYPCECGHQAFWHADRDEGAGSGSCEHDGECPCLTFTSCNPEPVSA